MEDAIGDQPSHAGGYLETVTTQRVRRLIYFVALERGFLDSIIDRVVVDPFIRLATQLTRLDRWLSNVVIPARRETALEGGEDRDE